MKKRLLALLMTALLALFTGACDDTVAGVQEDVEEGTDELEQEADEETDG